MSGKSGNSLELAYLSGKSLEIEKYWSRKKSGKGKIGCLENFST